MTQLSDHVVFNDQKLARRYQKRRIPMATLYEAYFAGDLDIPGDIYALLRDRNQFVKYSLTQKHLQWAVTNFVPEVAIHSKKQDERIVREHYDRGNDFFGWFLGERMVYTSGFFKDPAKETLEQAQDNKLNLVCQKVQLEKGQRMLDIGCGWGTLACHAARDFGAESTGVTIAKNQVEFANKRAESWGVAGKAKFICQDYREIKGKFDKITSLEMVEHVGVKNLRGFYELVRDHLEDDGLFLLQWTGLRRGLRPEDLIWGLFMNKYIFPGADASLAPAPMLAAMEKAGWEMHSVENISIHYAWTIREWHKNWISNRDAVVKAYGEKWYRIWHLFLAWSSIIGEQGNAACFQVVLNKNLDSFDRTRWVQKRAVILGDRAKNLDPRRSPQPEAAE